MRWRLREKLQLRVSFAPLKLCSNYGLRRTIGAIILVIVNLKDATGTLHVMHLLFLNAVASTQVHPPRRRASRSRGRAAAS